MCTVLRLHYFNIRGYAQAVRNLLYYLQIPFEDVIHPRTEENEKECGFNLGLPLLEDGEVRVHEATAIMMYLCKREKRESLIGLTPQHAARVNEVLMKYNSQKKKIMNSMLEVLAQLHAHQDIEKELAKMVDDHKFIDFCLKGVDKTKFIFDDLTIVDFIFYEICFYVVGFFGKEAKRNATVTRFIDYKKKFQLLPFYEKNKNQNTNRPLFFEFVNKKLNQSIEQHWDLCAKPLLKQ